MAALRLLVEALLVCFVLMQIVVPALRGTQWFPMFRKEAKLNNELEEVRQQAVEDHLEEELNKLKKGRDVSDNKQS